MKIVIQVASADDAKAWDFLQRHSPGVALPNRTYIISEEVLRELSKARIRFTELSRDAGMTQGVAAAERI